MTNNTLGPRPVQSQTIPAAAPTVQSITNGTDNDNHNANSRESALHHPLPPSKYADLTETLQKSIDAVNARKAIGQFQFHKATKQGSRVRLAIAGPGGSGKTFTLLTIATELGGKIALVDTEHGSASKYADLFDFDVLELASYDPSIFPELIKSAAAQGYSTLITDSLSHFWAGQDGELEQVDRITARNKSGNSWAAWREVSPKHNRMVDAMLSAPIHILVSMRVKTEWVLDKDLKTGKIVPRKVGLQPIMRDGVEYEFDVCGDMDQENTLQITKTRCPKLAGGAYPKPGKELAETLMEWLETVSVQDPHPQESNAAPAMTAESKKNVLVDNIGGLQPASMIPEELASIWKRMCTPRGVVKELDDLRTAVEELAGSTGVAEYCRILRQHGVNHPKQFKASQPARVCAKEVFGLLERLRRNAGDNQDQLPLVSNCEQGTVQTSIAQEVK